VIWAIILFFGMGLCCLLGMMQHCTGIWSRNGGRVRAPLRQGRVRAPLRHVIPQCLLRTGTSLGNGRATTPRHQSEQLLIHIAWRTRLPP
jgi:hypothetical protein